METIEQYELLNFFMIKNKWKSIGGKSLNEMMRVNVEHFGHPLDVERNTQIFCFVDNFDKTMGGTLFDQYWTMAIVNVKLLMNIEPISFG